MARIVIAGCGDVGTALGLLLIHAGHEVWGLRRSPEYLPEPIKPIAADVSRSETLQSLPPNLDAVVYSAAASGYDEAAYQATYVDGVRQILTALITQQQALSRFVLVSSTSVYGQTDAQWITEDSSAEAEGFAGQCIRAGEQWVWDGPYPAVVVRFGGIYGPGRTRLLDSVRRGQARCVADVYSNRIHRDDCAAVLAHVLTLDDPAQLYLGVDNAPVLQCEVMGWLAAQLGRAPPTTVSADVLGRQRRGSNKRCSNARLRASGYEFLYPSYREGYRALIDSDAP